jgi:hypothetical protein
MDRGRQLLPNGIDGIKTEVVEADTDEPMADAPALGEDQDEVNRQQPDEPDHALSEAPLSPPASHSPTLSPLRNEDGNLALVEDCISYVREALTSQPPRPFTHFSNIPVSAFPTSESCILLRQAALEGLAQLAFATSDTETYTIARRPPVAPLDIGEHWWAGLTPAQVRAGPWADEEDVRQAEGELAKLEERKTLSRQRKNGRLSLELRVIEEGIRRQKAGLRMYGNADVVEHEVSGDQVDSLEFLEDVEED